MNHTYQTNPHSGTISGYSMPKDDLPDWEQVLSAAAHLQTVLTNAVLVGGTAAALYAHHRFSRDADHTLLELAGNFDEILLKLESVAGWKTARIRRPVLILGNLDGIETGVRQLIRETPLETTQITVGKKTITIPTPAEMLRIKAVLILKRNATRDYLDFAALADSMGNDALGKALIPFDKLYPQPSGESALQQLAAQLSSPLPYDLDKANLNEYKNLLPPWTDWRYVEAKCSECSIIIFDALPSAETSGTE